MDVRPLATIEPTAIRPESRSTRTTATATSPAKAVLITPAKADATLFVAWEHVELQKIVQSIMNSYGGGAAVPAWTTGDYDSACTFVRVDYAGVAPELRGTI